MLAHSPLGMRKSTDLSGGPCRLAKTRTPRPGWARFKTYRDDAVMDGEPLRTNRQSACRDRLAIRISRFCMGNAAICDRARRSPSRSIGCRETAAVDTSTPMKVTARRDERAWRRAGRSGLAATHLEPPTNSRGPNASRPSRDGNGRPAGRVSSMSWAVSARVASAGRQPAETSIRNILAASPQAVGGARVFLSEAGGPHARPPASRRRHVARAFTSPEQGELLRPWRRRVPRHRHWCDGPA